MTNAAALAVGPLEVPSGMEDEAKLLEALAEVPSISAVIARQQSANASTMLTVSGTLPPYTMSCA